MFLLGEWRTVMVAIASAITPIKQQSVPIIFNLVGIFEFIIKAKPIVPIIKPAKPHELSFSLKKNHKKTVTTSGNKLAIVAAKLA